MKSGVSVPKFLAKNKCQTALLQCARDEQGSPSCKPPPTVLTLSKKPRTAQDGFTGRLFAKFSSLRHAAKCIADDARQQFTHGVEVTTDYVKEKTVQSLALAIGFGTLLGIIIGRC